MIYCIWLVNLNLGYLTAHISPQNLRLINAQQFDRNLIHFDFAHSFRSDKIEIPLQNTVQTVSTKLKF